MKAIPEIFRSLVVIVTVVLTSLSAHASERGTPEEARAMVERAINLFDAAGPETALAAINEPDPDFKDRDLYVFVVGPAGRVVAHGFDIGRLGLDVSTVKDSAGNPYGQQILDQASTAGVWIDYLRTDPETGEERQKSSWIRKHANYIFGVGVYR